MLKEFALQALSRAANLRKARNELNDEVAEWEGKAWLAECLIVRRKELMDSSRIDGPQESLNLGRDPLREVQAQAAPTNGGHGKAA